MTTRPSQAVPVDFESWLVAREHALQRTALLLTGDPHRAQDLVQSTLTKLYLKWDRTEQDDRVDAFTRRVLVNEHRSTWRRVWRRHEVITGVLPDPAQSLEHDAVWALVASLPSRQRAVVVLRYFEDLTEAETADLLGISRGTVKSQAYKALAALRANVGDRPTSRPPDRPTAKGEVMSSTEDMLRRALHARADVTAYQPTSVRDVTRRARAFRRKRTGTAALVAAAALVAVGVPAGSALSTSDSDRTPSPAGPTVTIGSLSELPTGAPPAVGYLLDRTFVFADGGQVELDVAPGSVLSTAPYPGGVLVTTRSQATNSSQPADHTWFARSGRLEHGGCGGEEVALSGDGRVFAYARTVRDCDNWGRWPVIQWGRTETMLGDPLHIDSLNGRRVEPVGVSAQRVLYNVMDTTRSRVPQGVFTIGKDGVAVEVPGIARATSWEPTTLRVTGCPSEGQCVVVDEMNGTVQLTLDPGEEPLSFSPDGRYLATAAGDGEPPSTVRVRDSRTGDIRVALAGDEAAFQGDDSVAWESSAHLLIARVDADGEALVRLGVDGSAELATSVAEPTIGGYLLRGP